ncbi:large subunit ribosomal protein L7Ae [Nematocida sp. LUAm3]|nr:large subunit ribosomal protein L7Ae [Nematocida sp. LUAm3]KAI5176167.1 large subunit ribosomal protein L7Ae [Nematocida sp. LUAm2]KAI5179261.1 large subunit ribosomal protein L7Ae [Nematocida sp. LUAm1]
MQPVERMEYKKKAPRNRRNSGQKHTKEMANAEREQQEKTIQKSKKALINAIKCPPAIHQFRQKMDEELKDKIEEVFNQYKPETDEEKAKRIEENREKKLALKFGIREVVKMIERKKAKLVLIANDVDPIVVVLFLPSLCKKMGVSYAIYDSKTRLGKMIGRKSAACVAITEVVPGLQALIDETDELFSKKYSETMKTWGKPVAK